MVLNLVGKVDWNLSNGIAFGLGDVACLPHLPYDEIATNKGLVRIEDGIVAGRLVDHPDQHRAFLDGQVRRILAEESLGRGLDSVGIAAEEDGVHVHIHNLVLGVVPLQFYGGYPFLELYPDHLHLGYSRNGAGDVLPRVEGLGELLGDGASSSLPAVSHKEGLDQHPGKAPEIDSRMFIEADILCRNGRMDEVRGEFLVADERTVLNVECVQDFAVLGYNLGGKFAVRVLQLLERRDVGKCPHKEQQQHYQEDRCH